MHGLSKPVRPAIVAAAFAAVALLGLTGTASATTPQSGDDRATAKEGNVVAQDCAELFPGSTAVDPAAMTVAVDESNTYLDVTAADGVVAVIVKGGPAYNVYQADDLGALPWLDLHAPLVRSGKPAQISHWFACGVTGTTTTETTTSETETSTTTETTTDTPTSSATETTTSAPAVTTTTSAATAPSANDDDLASTGFSGGWLIVLGAILLLGGGAALVVARLRGARR
jgi:cell division septation protein DedD